MLKQQELKELELVTGNISFCEVLENQCEVYVPSDCLVLLNLYFASLPLMCFPRIKLNKSNAGITCYSSATAQCFERVLVEWDSGQKVKAEMG